MPLFKAAKGAKAAKRGFGRFFRGRRARAVPAMPAIAQAQAPAALLPLAPQRVAGIPVAAGLPAPLPGGALARLTAPILFKIARHLGLRAIPSLEAAMRKIRALGRFLQPALIASTLGITLTELATLITSRAARRRRRMNPANARALRRAVRRLTAFDRLADRTRESLRRLMPRRGFRARRGRRGDGRRQETTVVC
jgi:hypothetical protein